jgi:hypothetical protein
MMFNHRLTRTAAVALAIAATAAPAASADDHWRSGSVAPEDQAQPLQDLRNPDTRDFAEGRGTYNSPEVVVVKSAAPAAEPTTAGGIDWEDVGIGAGGLLTASLIALGGTLLVVQRRGARAHAAH